MLLQCVREGDPERLNLPESLAASGGAGQAPSSSNCKSMCFPSTPRAYPHGHCLALLYASPQPVFHSELSVYALVRCINSRRPVIWKGERTGLGGLLNVAAACPAPKLCTT